MCMTFIPASPLESLIHGRVAVFIDASNLYHSQKNLGWEVDFNKLADYFNSLAEQLQLHFYTAIESSNESQLKFLRKMKSYGYTIHSKEIKILKNNKGIRAATKGNLDVELALDAYRLKNTFDEFILFSGDSDFAYFLKVLRGEGKKIVVISTKDRISFELKTEFKYVDLVSLKSYIQKHNEPT
jgi:uncharacterized LabA/DUF88 family protein